MSILASVLIFAAEEVGEGAEHAEEVVNPILPTAPEMFWGAVCFFGLWALMKYVLLPPVLKHMEAREAGIAASKARAAEIDAGIATASADVDAALAGSRAEAADIIEAARAEADARRNELVAAAQADIALLRESSLAEVAAAKATAMQQLRGDVAEVATSAASAVVQRPLDAESSARIVNEYVAASSGDA